MEPLKCFRTAILCQNVECVVRDNFNKLIEICMCFKSIFTSFSLICDFTWAILCFRLRTNSSEWKLMYKIGMEQSCQILEMYSVYQKKVFPNFVVFYKWERYENPLPWDLFPEKELTSSLLSISYPFVFTDDWFV